MITPYLVFPGTCAEALIFYREVFQCPEPRVLPYGTYVPEGLDPVPERLSEWVMHAEMPVCGTNVWFADEPGAEASGGSVRLTVTLPTAGQARSCFAQLTEGGTVTLPPTETFYSSFHAAGTDRFGTCWNVVAEEAPEGGQIHE